jgi:thiol-disulfide isomerase/thioredoxin
MAQDEDLASIRKHPRFAELAKQVENNARSHAEQAARDLLAAASPFPFTLELSDLDGKKVSLADFKGKVVVVEFWGTWCPPCRKEVPHLKELFHRYAKEGLVILGVGYERALEADVKEIIRAFVKEHQVPYPCLLGDEKTRAQVPDFFGYPTQLFLDRSGNVRGRVVGYQSLSELDAIVRLLLEESPKTN